MTIAVIQFSASNCDRDALHVFQNVLQTQCEFVWQDTSILPPNTKAVVLPGGFSFGDYLRAGAMAAHRPIMKDIKRFAQAGGPVLGICNGFQILCEAKILPGVLMPNHNNQFICSNVALNVTGGGYGALKHYAKDERITLPIAHHDGRYYADDDTIKQLETHNRIALQYVDDVNGSKSLIAGIFGGPEYNVLGLMPHPERRSEMCLGGIDGIQMLRGLYV